VPVIKDAPPGLGWRPGDGSPGVAARRFLLRGSTTAAWKGRRVRRVEHARANPPADPPVPGGVAIITAVGLAEAVERSGWSRNRLRRLLKTGAVEGAERLLDGSWRIPVPSLLAAGVPLDRATAPRDPEDDGGAPPGTDPHLGALQTRLAELEATLAVERTRREGLERLVAQQADHLADVRLALRALGPGPDSGLSPGAHPPAPGTDPLPRQWWRRRKGTT